MKNPNTVKLEANALIPAALGLLMLAAGLAGADAAITDGFTQKTVSVIYQWPYNLNLSDRHSGTFPGLEHFWVYTNDAPHDPPPNTTSPRCEAELSPQWTSGVWQFEGDVEVPSGTTGVNIMQVFGADPTIGSTSLMLRTYSGNFNYYHTHVLEQNIWDQWHHVNVIHDDNVHTIQIYIDNVLMYLVNDNDNGTHPIHYFKYGVYQAAPDASYLTADYWQNVKVWYTPSLPVTPVLGGDFDNDGVPDAVVFNRSLCSWSVRFSTNASVHTFPFGQNGDIPLLDGDWDGDGQADAVVFCPSDGNWYVRYSKDGSIHNFAFGQSGDIPLLGGDYDGDGQPDAVFFRPSNSTWYVRFSKDASVHSFLFGNSTDIPLLKGDWDGDGQPDSVLFRPSNGNWYVRFSSDASIHNFAFGQNGDIPIIGGDYDGDGQPDAVIFRPSTGWWYVRFSHDESVHSFQFGQSGDIPMVNGDWDGDGQPDSVLYRPSNNTWYVRFSNDGSVHSFSF